MLIEIDKKKEIKIMKTLFIYQTNDQKKIFFFATNHQNIDRAVPSSVEYYICKNQNEYNKIMSKKINVDEIDWQNLSTSYYFEGDHLLESDLRNLQKKENAKLIIGRNDGELWNIIDGDYWNFETAISYYDGNNERIRYLNYEDTVEIIEEIDRDPEPAFYFSKDLKIKYESGAIENIAISTSNTSGYLTPWWE